MIVTKEHQEAMVDKYVKEKHNQDECLGFIDGLNAALELVKNLTIPDVSNRRQLLIAFFMKNDTLIAKKLDFEEYEYVVDMLIKSNL
jgi:hypothetical protein